MESIKGGFIVKMFVFRRTKGESGREPIGACPVNFDVEKVKKRIKDTKRIHIKHGDEVQYILDELNKGRLRQGWGCSNPDLDLNLPDNVWTENFAVACHKYWGESLSGDICKYAMGRKIILNHMLDMNKRDIVFVPKTPDEKCFVVTTVKNKYKFDRNTTTKDDDFRNDFRHLIGVEKTKTFQYSRSTLEPGIFGAPFLHAIDPINLDYEAYASLKHFISKHYL